MRDREAVNRFCAFAIVGLERYSSGELDGFLAEALESMNKMTPEELGLLEARFLLGMRVNEALFKRHAFRKSLRTGSDANRSPLNIALFDVCSVVLSSLSEETVQAHSEAIKESIAALLTDVDFDNSITYATNDKRRVRTRFEKMVAAIAEATK